MARRIRIGSIVELLSSFKKNSGGIYSDEFMDSAMVGEVGIVCQTVDRDVRVIFFFREVKGWRSHSICGDEIPSGHLQACLRKDLGVVLDPL